MSRLQPFHLAIAVHDLSSAVAFYRDIFGCTVGRRAERWADLNFYGHQLSLHAVEEDTLPNRRNKVDGHAVPSRHFGVVLPWDRWRALAQQLEDADFDFIIAPYIRFEGEAGEQGTLFIADPSGNVLEFKSFKDPSQLFAS